MIIILMWNDNGNINININNINDIINIINV